MNRPIAYRRFRLLPSLRSPLAGIVAAVLLAIPLGGCDRSSEPSATSATAAKKEPLPSDAALRERIDRVLDFTQNDRHLSSEVHAAWQILHGALAYGRSFEIVHEGKRVPALDWVLDGGKMKGWTMRRGPKGLKAVLEPGTKTGQGHEDQWLAVIAQSDLPADHPVVVGSTKYRIGDLVNQAKYDLFDGKECSWTLIGLSTYLPADVTWKARDGGIWSLERIMAMEANQDLAVSACGGTHRLIGMTMALKRFEDAEADAKDEPPKLTAGWLAAQQKIRQAVDLAREYQLPNGAFSINYFQRSANAPDMAAHLGASGHTLEFLSLALDNQQLHQEWITRGVVHLCELL
ncbi:MAG: ADP-ribosylation factor-directed GTPase activating protein isoform b, partial [Pirellulales bacterium]